MKLKLLFSLTLVCMGVLFFQSCTSEVATENETYEADVRETDGSDETDPADTEPATKYCRYNVATTTDATLIAVGHRVCFPCDEPCGKDMDTTIGFGNKTVKVTGTRSSKKCLKCTQAIDHII